MSMGGSKYADRSELSRKVLHAVLPRYFDLNAPKSTPQFHRGVHYACLCRYDIWPRSEPPRGFKVLLQTLLRRERRSYHALVGYFEVIDFEEGKAREMPDCKMCPRVLRSCEHSSKCRAPRYLKVHFKSVMVFKEPYFLEPADIRGILHKERLTSWGPPLSSINREEFYQAYGRVAYLWQRWINYRVLHDRQSILEQLVKSALSRTEILEIRVGKWPCIIEKVVEKVREFAPKRKPKKEKLKRLKAALRFAGLSQYINVFAPSDCCN